MSIIREHGKFIAVCDICFESLPEEDTFQDAVDAQKEAGWTGVKIEGEWHSKCADCREAGI